MALTKSQIQRRYRDRNRQRFNDYRRDYYDRVIRIRRNEDPAFRESQNMAMRELYYRNKERFAKMKEQQLKEQLQPMTTG